MSAFEFTPRDVLKTAPSELFHHLDSEFSRGYGSELNHPSWIEWAPETILTSLPGLKEVPGTDDDVARDKILAVHAVAVNTELTCHSDAAFEKVVQAFNNNYVIVGAAQHADIEEIAYAVREIEKISQAVHKSVAHWGGDVPGYIAESGRAEGWLVLPRCLAFAQERLLWALRAPQESRKYNEMSSAIATLKNLADEFAGRSVDLQHLDQFIGATKDPILSAGAVKLIGAELYDPTTLEV